MRLASGLAALAVLLWCAAPPPARAQDKLPVFEDEVPENLPEGQGREETFYACVVCHGSALIKQQGMSRARWDDLLDWMIARHSMPPPDLDDRKLIVDYLAASFPPRARGKPNPFLGN